MSNVRLIPKLLEAGLDEEQIQAMNRNELLTAYAELVAALNDKPPGAASPVAYDPEVEKQRLEFEMKKYEQERELKAREFELKERELEEAKRKTDLKETELVEARRIAEEENFESRARYEYEMRLRERELQI